MCVKKTRPVNTRNAVDQALQAASILIADLIGAFQGTLPKQFQKCRGQKSKKCAKKSGLPKVLGLCKKEGQNPLPKFMFRGEEESANKMANFYLLHLAFQAICRAKIIAATK